MKKKSFFSNKNAQRNRDFSKCFTEKKSWDPPSFKLSASVLNLADQLKLCTDEFLEQATENKQIMQYRDNRFESRQSFLTLRHQPNLSKAEADSLNALSSNGDIIIKPADKGGATVLMNRKAYIGEALRQLNNTKYYKKLSAPLYKENVIKIEEILNDMLKKSFISKEQYTYLSGPEEPKPRCFYLLPKIHKPKEKWPNFDMPEGRPIVSDVNSETYRISEYIDHYVNPLAMKHESFIKNTYDFITKLKSFASQNNYLLVTGDVSALYTNMNIDRSIECVKKAFDQNPDPHRPDKHILELLEISLKFNDFEFNDEFYLQVMGTAMGKRFAPGLSNLYMLDFDRIAMHDFKIKPLLYFRYLDDIFLLFPGDETSLKEYEIFLNNIIPDIKVTLEHSNTEINFLDVTVYKNDVNQLKTKVFFKKTDTHQLLHRSSHHPNHTFNGIVKSQLIRFKRISSTKTDYDETCKILFSFLKNRGYTHAKMRKLQHEIWHNYNCDQPIEKSKNDLIPIVVEFNDFNCKLAKEYKTLIQRNNQFKESKTVIAYKNGKNLKQILVKSKLKTEKLGHFRTCGEARCGACPLYSRDTTKFQSSVTGKSYGITGKITCKSKNLVYVINCRKCKRQYVGETGHSLRERLSQHRSDIRLKKNTAIGVHFNSEGHSHLDVKMIPIEQFSENNSDVRRRKEKHWQKVLRSVYPEGLNGLVRYD